jgi:PAS domain S-box-containing protein
MSVVENRYTVFITLVSLVVILFGMGVNIYAVLLEMKIANPAIMGNLPIAKDTASCFILVVGFSLILQLYKNNRVSFYTSRTFALISFLIPVMSLLQNFFTRGYQDNLSVISNNVYFGMSVQSAFCFMCMGFALFFLHSEKMRYINQLLLHIVTGIAFMVVLGHILYIPHFYLLTFFSAMAIYAAIAFFFFSIAASLINPTVGLTGMVTGNRIGNVMARRLSTRILGAMLLISSALIFFYRHQWLGLDFAIALFAVTFFTITLFFIYKTSEVLNKIERKKEIASENFRSVIESAPNALVISDMKGRISLVNKQANKIFGYVDGELIGKSLETIVPERFRNAHHLKQPHYFKDPKPRHFGQVQDLYALRSDGSEFPVEIGLTPIITEEGTVALASIVDITELKHNEAIIRKQMSEIQIKSHEMEQFIYIASHDLQEPLRTLLNYIQLLEEDYPEQLNGEICEHLSVMKSAITRMGVLVRSLLDYGRLGQNRVLALTNVGKIVKDVLADLNTLIKTTGTTVEVVTDLPELYVYETELRQLFQNLINNAIKFRKPDVAPVIKIGCVKHEGHYEFFVSDNGIGIDPKYFQRIFLMFQRLHKEEEYKGYGVGLAYCNKIADIHCGRIWVESEPGEGSIFKFTILIMNDEDNN